jgi:hypothetical protein
MAWAIVLVTTSEAAAMVSCSSHSNGVVPAWFSAAARKKST